MSGDLTIRLGEKIDLKGRRMTVTETAYECLPRVREVLIGVARRRGTITYSDLKNDAELDYTVNGMGRLLDLLSVECFRRDEPSLAALVVNQASGEVGADFNGDPVAERRALYAKWGTS